jgi:hypothetical protein
MQVLEVEAATVDVEFPDSPRIATPPPEEASDDEEEEEEEQRSSNAHSMLGTTSGKMGAAMQSLSMKEDASLPEEALMPRAVRVGSRSVQAGRGPVHRKRLKGSARLPSCQDSVHFQRRRPASAGSAVGKSAKD